MEIEEIARNSPDTIVREVVEPAVGMTAFQARELAFGLKLTDRVSLFEEGIEVVQRAWTEDRVNFAGQRYTLKDIAVRVLDSLRFRAQAAAHFDIPGPRSATAQERRREHAAGCRQCADIDRPLCAEGEKLLQAWNQAMNTAYEQLHGSR